MNKTKNRPTETKCVPIGDAEASTMRDAVLLVDGHTKSYGKESLLVLDEPFVGLDPQAAYRLKGVMKKLVSRGAAIFFSSYVLEVVEKLCDEVAIIENGRIVKSGRTNDICGSEDLEQVFLDVAPWILAFCTGIGTTGGASVSLEGTCR